MNNNQNMSKQRTGYNTQTEERNYTNQEMPTQIKKSILPYISLILFTIYIWVNIIILQSNKHTDFDYIILDILFGTVLGSPVLFGSFIFGYVALRKYFQKKIIINRFWLCICWIITLFPIILILSIVIFSTIFPIIVQIIN